jgi:hypothetical protein
MQTFESAAEDPQFAQTVRNRLDAIAKMGGPSPMAGSPPFDVETDGERVGLLDESTRRRPPTDS